jgi:hypothetical protein
MTAPLFATTSHPPHIERVEESPFTILPAASGTCTIPLSLKEPKL